MAEGIISPSFLDDSKKDFETGDIFKYGVPASAEDGERAVNGLVARTKAAIDKIQKVESGTTTIKDVDFVSLYEIYSLEALSVTLLTQHIPEIFEWQIDGESKNSPATLLGIVWSKEMKWLPHWLKQVDNDRNASSSAITSHILLSPLDKFEAKSSQVCKQFYKWLVGKAERQAKKEKEIQGRGGSLNDPTTYKDGSEREKDVPDEEAEVKIIKEASYEIIKKQLWPLIEELPSKTKAAVVKGMNREKLNGTERRARNRGKIKLKKIIEERGLSDRFKGFLTSLE